MFRKPDGSKGFSFMRLVDNTQFTMRSNNSDGDPGTLSLTQQDLLYIHQLSSANPQCLNDTSFFAAGVVTSESFSHKIFQKLQKSGVLGEDGSVHTEKIEKGFVNDLASVSAGMQKQVVEVLFWWEEEARRLGKLVEERKESEGLVAKGEEGYGELLERVKGKIRAKPSERDTQVEADEDELIVRFRESQKG